MENIPIKKYAQRSKSDPKIPSKDNERKPNDSSDPRHIGQTDPKKQNPSNLLKPYQWITFF